MPQVPVYLSDELLERLRAQMKLRGVASQSKFVQRALEYAFTLPLEDGTPQADGQGA